MIIKFTDSYVDDINIGLTLIGSIHCKISNLEPFVGNSPVLDQMYSISILINGIIDHLMNDDNSKPEDNVAMLLCLRSLNDSNICGPPCNPVLDMKNYHNIIPYPTQEKVFIQ